MAMEPLKRALTVALLANTVLWTSRVGAQSTPAHQIVHPVGPGQTLYNGIQVPAPFPVARAATQLPQTPTYLTNPPAVIPIDIGRQLFVDDFLIEQTNLVRSTHRPQFYPGNPLLSPNGVNETRNQAMPYSDGIWYDPADHQYKMWYFGGQGSMLCYSTSADGKIWVRPVLNIVSTAYTNCVLDMGGGRDSGSVWMDLETTDPARKFKAFMYAAGGFMKVFHSPDGIRWTPYPNLVRTGNDRTTLVWNPFRKVWINNMRGHISIPASPLRPATRSTRARYYAESTDLQNFTLPDVTATFWTAVDDLDPDYCVGCQHPQLYSMDAVAYESVMVGLFSMLHPGPGEEEGTAPGPELVEIGSVGFSRDGFQWHRPIRGAGKGPSGAFIPASNIPQDWQGYNTQAVGGGFLVVGDELWFYYSARNQMHYLPWQQTTSHTGLATLRRDGFVSMDAPAAEGSLTTRPVTFHGNRLFVNVDDPNGSLQVEVLAADGRVIAPFTKANSIPFRGNKTLQEMKWNGVADLSSLAGQTVRFRFYLTNGKLYSFWVTPDAHGASYGYVAAGGPGFTGPTDTVGSAAVLPPPQTADTQPPSIPAGLAATVVSHSAVNLSWNASTDNVRVAGYRLYRNGSAVANVTGTSYSDSGLSPLTSYTYTVAAYDAAGNASQQSSSVVARTLALAVDTVAPAVSITAPAANATVSGIQNVTASASDNVGVTGVQFKLGGVNLGSALTAPPYTIAWNTTNVSNGAHALSAVAFDAAGNSTVSAAVTVIVANSAPSPPPSNVYTQKVEGEDATYDRAFFDVLYSGTSVSNGSFIRGNIRDVGTLTYSFSVPAAGTYQLWGRVSAVPAPGSFYVAVDGQNEQLWTDPAWNQTWQWFKLNAPGVSPRVLSLSSGAHTITIRTARPNVSLDALILTNDLGAVPQGVSGGLALSEAPPAGAPAPLPLASAPVVSPSGGSFSAPVQVTLSSATPNAAIYYTTNGTAPAIASARYTGPFTLSASATLKAKAVLSGYTDSSVVSATFVISVPSPSTPPAGPPRPRQYIKVEAESVPILSPFQSLYSGSAVSGGIWIRSTQANIGTLTYSVSTPAAGAFYLWGRMSAGGKGGSFYVSVDGAGEQLWSDATWKSGTWTWSKLAGPSGVRTLNLASGAHSIRVRAAQAQSYADVFILTDDLAFVPTGVSGR